MTFNATISTLSARNTKPADGGTPGPGTTEDDDNPINLSQETVITVTVNDAWDTIYNLGIE